MKYQTVSALATGGRLAMFVRFGFPINEKTNKAKMSSVGGRPVGVTGMIHAQRQEVRAPARSVALPPRQRAGSLED